MNTYDPVAFATQEVKQFDAVMREHVAATSCHECEEVFAAGIMAFRWIERGEETVIQAETDCLAPYSEPVHAMIANLYRSWVELGQRAENVIAALQTAGYTPEDLDEFRQCRQRAETWVQTQAAIEAATPSHDQLADYARR